MKENTDKEEDIEKTKASGIEQKMCLFEPTGKLNIVDEYDKVKEGESDSGVDTWFSDADEEGIRNVYELKQKREVASN